METIADPGSTKPLIQLLGREDGCTKLLGHRDCLSLCHYAGAKAIISVEPGHRFLSEGTTDWEHLISPGRNIIYPIHKQISRFVINIRKAYMKQMVEGWRAQMTTKEQDKGTWTGVCSLMPFPSHPRSVRKTLLHAGRRRSHDCVKRGLVWEPSPSEAVRAAGGPQRVDNTWTSAVSTAQGGQHCQVCLACTETRGIPVKMCNTNSKHNRVISLAVCL